MSSKGDFMNGLIFLIIASFFMSNTVLFASQIKQKVLIMTPTSNHPEFIAMQDKAFKKFFKDDYEFVVFNDALEDHITQGIFKMCASLNIRCIRVPQENRIVGHAYSWASYRHGQAIDYMMQTMGFNHDGIVVLIDSDMFPIKEFSVNKFLKGYDIAGLSRGIRGETTEYLWAGLIFFRMNTLPSRETMSFQVDDKTDIPLDSGGALSHYFYANPSIKRLFFKQKGRLHLGRNSRPLYAYTNPYRETYLRCQVCVTKKIKECRHKNTLYKNLGFREEIIDLIMGNAVPRGAEFLIKDTFFHVAGSSGYGNMSMQERAKKNEKIKAFMNILLA